MLGLRLANGNVTDVSNDVIVESDLKAVDTAADENILTYESTGGDFEWHTPAEIITAGLGINWSGTTLNTDVVGIADSIAGNITAGAYTDDSINNDGTILYPGTNHRCYS